MGQKHWIQVEPIHCHKCMPENTLVEKVRIASDDNKKCEAIMKFNPDELKFFYDHEIDHLPGMLEICAIRQCALAVGHLIYGIPLNYEAVLGWLNIEFDN